ncbi:MAG: AMP-binding protein [Planctomycetales bacterium]|nr:AMP-binding protein [Planctomycetales bacterium]NIM08762.1 AMP-binding protein [Planctomycetales bacterium]NIN08225.1 AMP-binding protein [Planctomycetales bacterium]NIN77353.1 AMP-binding protein [Planctomycetales bacterium]NIO34536.1 AMP-binding protein [Planctomycetales bacterium]
MATDSASDKPWVDGLTIDQVLQQTTARRQDADCLVFPALNFQLSYLQFNEHVDRIARGLMALGIRRGEHVAIWATNVPEWVILQFATARIGAVLVNINPAYRPFELKYVLQQSDAVALFLIGSFKKSDYFAMLAEICPELATATPGELSSQQFPQLRLVVAIDPQPPAGALAWDQLLARADAVDDQQLAARIAELDPQQPINIQYTSGTTGFPKAATLSHRNLLLNAYYSGQCQRMTSEDRICIPVPFYHCFGCVLGTLMSAVYGTAMIVPAESFDPTATLDAIERERATVLYGVPTMFIAELEDETFGQRNLSSLRTGIMAGSPCPIEIMRKVIDRMGAREITIGYGQTEASPIVTQTRTDDPLELRVETVGRPIPGVEIKIIDPNSGQELGDNQQGELCSRGHVVMLGYYKDPQATRMAIDEEGWLHSGDLALRQPNGYYRITGRIKDMVIRGGENIYPREIEEFLFTHPAIEQAAVVGVPDPKYGEELCTWIRLKTGNKSQEEMADQIRQYCRDHLAHYKVPRYVRFVDSFPQTVTGKIQKFKIREQMISDLDLKEPETA